MKLKFKNFYIIIISMILCACGSEGSLPEQQTLSFKMSTITKSDYKCEQIYPAQMKGCQDIKLMPKIEGYLKEIYVKDGDKVKKGQLLFSIDKTDFQGAVASAKAGVCQAEALLGKAEQEFEGKKILNEKNIISEFELTQSKRDVDVAKANLESAKAQLEIATNALSDHFDYKRLLIFTIPSMLMMMLSSHSAALSFLRFSLS